MFWFYFGSTVPVCIPRLHSDVLGFWQNYFLFFPQSDSRPYRRYSWRQSTLSIQNRRFIIIIIIEAALEDPFVGITTELESLRIPPFASTFFVVLC